MAQNFWTAIDACTVCFVVTIVVQPDDAAAADAELVGLVYSLTDDAARRAAAVAPAAGRPGRRRPGVRSRC